MSTERKKHYSLLINIAIIVFELIGKGISFYNGGIVNLRFYTVLSNIFLFITSLLTIRFATNDNKLPSWFIIARYASVCCTTMTFLVVVFVLFPMLIPYGDPFSIFISGAQPFHHVLCPILAFISFIWFEDIILTRITSLLSAIPTLIYAVVLILLNYFRLCDGPYPFLRVHYQPIVMSFIWFFVLIGLSIAISFGIKAIKAKVNKNT